VPEAGHDPFLPVMVLAEHTRRVSIATGIAVAFPRSPMVTAQLAWDLQRFAGGRFVLGLGTQVKAHNTRRYSTPWPSPAGPRLREYILCLKAIFKTFQGGARPEFRGDHYQFTLMSPFFNPGPNQHPDVPIHISAVNRHNCRLAGELCDGNRMHPLNTPAYIKDVIRPAVENGCRASGRDITEVEIVANPFTITGKGRAELDEARALIRRHISFYASTPTYFAVMEHHGWRETGQHLHSLSREGRWQEMPDLVSDEMLRELAVEGTWDELPDRIAERYGGLVTGVNLVFGPPYQELQERQRRMFENMQAIMPGLKAIR
jgi:probable F420-dependent oxidoreductase